MIESGCVHLCLFCFRTYWMCPCNSIFVSPGLNIELDVLLLLKLYSVRLISSLRIICASLLFNVFMKTFLFLFYFLLPIKLLPDAALNALKVPTAARCCKLLRNSCSPRLPPCIGQTEASEHIQTGAEQICCMFDLEEDMCCVSLFLQSSCRRRFFLRVFADASISSSSDCFKNTPVSLFSTVKSALAVTVEWLNSLGYHI